MLNRLADSERGRPLIRGEGMDASNRHDFPKLPSHGSISLVLPVVGNVCSEHRL